MHLYAEDTQLYISLDHSFKFNFFTWNTLQYFLWHSFKFNFFTWNTLPILSLTYSPGWTLTNCSSIHPKLNSYSMVQNNSSNFLNSQLYLSAVISSQSALLLVILHGFIFDSDMSFTDQINSLSKSCHFHIDQRHIRRIRHLLPLSAATALFHSSPASKLDYCNSLYNGISQANLNKIQRIQNTLARVVTNTSKFEHITPILKNYIGFQSNNASVTNCVFLHITLQIQQPIPIFTIAFLFILTL